MNNEYMKSCMPSFITESKIFGNIYDAEYREFDTLEKKIEDLNNQLSIDTATWALSIYENEMGIKTESTKSFDERRAVIKSKWRGTGKIDGKLIKMVADAYTNGQVDVTFDGKINIKFNSIIGIPNNLDDLKKALEDIKPVNLRLEYIFSYLLLKDIDGGKTLRQLETIPLNKFAGGEING